MFPWYNGAVHLITGMILFFVFVLQMNVVVLPSAVAGSPEIRPEFPRLAQNWSTESSVRAG